MHNSSISRAQRRASDRLRAGIGCCLCVVVLFLLEWIGPKMSHAFMLAGWGEWRHVPGFLITAATWVCLFVTYGLARSKTAPLRWWQLGPTVALFCIFAAMHGLTIMMLSEWPTD